MTQNYQIEFSPEVEIHLRSLTKREQNIVLDAIFAQLSYQATVRHCCDSCCWYQTKK